MVSQGVDGPTYVETTYDNVDWHLEGDFPKKVPRRHAFNHIAMFLTWIVDQDLHSDWLAKTFPVEVAAVKARTMKGSDLADRCDGVLDNLMLNANGNAFAKYYYTVVEGRIRYYDDYERTLCSSGPTIYHATDTWRNYNKPRSVIDERYEAWRRTRPYQVATSDSADN